VYVINESNICNTISGEVYVLQSALKIWGPNGKHVLHLDHTTGLASVGVFVITKADCGADSKVFWVLFE
jgi:hypothetical protein